MTAPTSGEIEPPLYEQLRAYFAEDPGRHTIERREALAREMIDVAGTIIGRDRAATVALEMTRRSSD